MKTIDYQMLFNTMRQIDNRVATLRSYLKMNVQLSQEATNLIDDTIYLKVAEETEYIDLLAERCIAALHGVSTLNESAIKTDIKAEGRFQ